MIAAVLRFFGAFALLSALVALIAVAGMGAPDLFWAGGVVSLASWMIAYVTGPVK